MLRPEGFSLVEVLVAVAILGLLVLALLSLSGEGTRTALWLEERAFAGHLAENIAVESALLPPAAITAAPSGVEQVGGRDWHWSRRVSDTAQPGLRRVDVEVWLDGHPQVLASRHLIRPAGP